VTRRICAPRRLPMISRSPGSVANRMISGPCHCATDAICSNTNTATRSAGGGSEELRTPLLWPFSITRSSKHNRARRGEAGMAGRGMAGQGRAWQARHVWARQGRRAKAGQGLAGQGRRGRARRGAVRRGRARRGRRGWARLGRARRGRRGMACSARQGWAGRRGGAGNGRAWRGRAGKQWRAILDDPQIYRLTVITRMFEVMDVGERDRALVYLRSRYFGAGLLAGRGLTPERRKEIARGAAKARWHREAPLPNGG
jgi:hypothetical protein